MFGNAGRKKLHKFGELFPSFSRKVLVKKYVQTLVRRSSPDFKTPQSSLKHTRGSALYFQLLSVFRNRRKSSYSCLNHYISTLTTLILPEASKFKTEHFCLCQGIEMLFMRICLIFKLQSKSLAKLMIHVATSQKRVCKAGSKHKKVWFIYFTCMALQDKNLKIKFRLALN